MGIFYLRICLEKMSESPENTSQMDNEVPLGVFGDVGDISRIVRYLLSNDTVYNWSRLAG